MDFNTFSEVFFKRFKFFGINPVYSKVENGKRAISRDKFSTIVVIFLLVVYWCGIIMSFFLKHKGNDQISAISNIIQLILNGVALSTILINVLLKYRTFDDIVTRFQVIDENLKDVGKKIRYHNSLTTSRSVLVTFGSFLLFSVIFDCYVTVMRYEMTPIWYWIVATLPSVVYSLSLVQSMFIIAWVSTRCRLINDILRLDARAKYLKALPVHAITGSMKGQMQKSVDLITRVYAIMSDLCQLSRTIDMFMGPPFLTTITAIFAVTSIQVYYIYVTTITMSELPESSGFSVWSLMVSLNIVLMNIFLVIGITTICECVNTETMRILQSFSELQINKEVPAELSIWLHPMISHMKFTAFGFFSIDYSMLCGFMTAIITYLVIFIQFYALEPVHGTDSVVKSHLPSMPMKSM